MAYETYIENDKEGGGFMARKNMRRIEPLEIRSVSSVREYWERPASGERDSLGTQTTQTIAKGGRLWRV